MTQKFKIKAPFKPSKDQNRAIEVLEKNYKKEVKHQTLLGVTGSGKTFTIANLIEKVNKPTLVIAHNKTLAAQLADEFREFFPENSVNYFVSYYDYYQPEAYIPSTDTYIEKDSSINDEIDRLRHSSTRALLSRSDCIVVASVSCIYGIGSPELYKSENFTFSVGQKISRKEFLNHLINQHYERNDLELKRGKFRLKGDTFEIFPAYSLNTYKVEFFGNLVEKISEVDWVTGQKIQSMEELEIFPASHFVMPQHLRDQALSEIRRDLKKQIETFKKNGKLLEAQRIKERTNYDLELIETTGFCSGIENYSRYFDQRKKGQPPTVLLDYFPKDFLLVIDESHMTVPQIGAMYAGDRSRKEKLIDFGFRLPSAFDNRPLKFDEFYQKINKVVFMSATPGKYEIEKSTKQNQINNKPKEYPAVIEQIVRPTGLLDPKIEIRQTKGQINNLLLEINATIKNRQRVLITTLTKKMAEELTDFIKEKGIKVAYIHSDVETLERNKILHQLRLGEYDVLIGINLLREGLDLPEVSLVAILDADKEGFLRSQTALIQTIGRAARHLDGHVIMYADKITDSMEFALNETTRRRKIQQRYNKENNIDPSSILKMVKPKEEKEEQKLKDIASIGQSLSRKDRQREINILKDMMHSYAKNLEFEKAAEIRDQISLFEKINKN